MTQAENLENPVIPVDDRKLPLFDEMAALAQQIGIARLRQYDS
ncbi:hypothetical protein ACFV2S_27570 [Streptomyces sp. NPDC059695]